MVFFMSEKIVMSDIFSGLDGSFRQRQKETTEGAGNSSSQKIGHHHSKREVINKLIFFNELSMQKMFISG